MTRMNHAAAHIVRADPAFRRIVETTGGMELRPEADSPFEALLSL